MKLSPKKEPISLHALNELIKGHLVGDQDVLIDHVSPIQDADKGAITLVANNDAKEIAKLQKATAYIIERKYADTFNGNGIIVEDGRLAFALVLSFFGRKVIFDGKISAKATVDPSAKIGKNVTVCDYAYISADTIIGDNTVIYPHVFIGPSSKIGRDCLIYPQVVIRENVVIGDRAILHPGVLVGVEGFGFVYTNNKWQKVPQIGGVIIGDDVELFSNTSIASGAAGPTVVEDGVKIGDMTHIGHNCHIGESSIMAGQIGISGSTVIGKRVKIGGHVMFAGHQTIGDDAGIMSKALVDGDLPPNSIVSGQPARDHKREMRVKASLQELPELRKQVKELIKKIEEITSQIEQKGN